MNLEIDTDKQSAVVCKCQDDDSWCRSPIPVTQEDVSQAIRDNGIRMTCPECGTTQHINRSKIMQRDHSIVDLRLRITSTRGGVG